MRTGTQRLMLAPKQGQSYEPVSTSPYHPASSPSWLPAFGPAATQSGQRGVAHMGGLASTDASVRTCRWDNTEMRSWASWSDGAQGSRLRQLTLHHHSSEAAPCGSPEAASHRAQHRSCHSRVCPLQEGTKLPQPKAPEG